MSEIAQLSAEIDQGIEDGIADYGTEMIEAGGWAEITRAVIALSDVSDNVKAEVTRMKGLQLL